MGVFSSCKEFEDDFTSKDWDIVNKAKNSTIQMIRKKSIEQDVVSAEKLREAILIEMTETESPSIIAISYFKEDLKTIF